MKKILFLLFTIFSIISCNEKSKTVSTEQVQTQSNIEQFKGLWHLYSAESEGIKEMISMGLNTNLGIYENGTFKLDVLVNGESQMQNEGTWTFSSDGMYLDISLPDKEYGGFTKGTIKKVGKSLHYKNPSDNDAMIFVRY